MRLQKKKKPVTQSQSNEPFIQPKLSIGKPGDKYEVEADSMADKVVSSSTANSTGNIQNKESQEEEIQEKPLASSITPWIQKQAIPEEEEPVQASLFKDKEGPTQEMEDPVQKQEEEEEPVQAMEEEEEAVQTQEEEEAVQAQEEEEEAIQPKSDNPNPSPSIETKLNNSHGQGNKISGGTKNEMEAGFGADFSHVNIHTDNASIQMNKELGAQAFTHGNDVYFNKGKYKPDTKEGKHLLAHELTHTIQQGGMINKKIQRHKLENDPKDAPPGMSCPIANSSAFGMKMSINHSVASSALSSSDKAMLSNLVMNWHASGGTETIRIDGYASIDGKPGLNWGLSCKRAEKVAAELMNPSDGSVGIPAANIDKFSNGETTQFSKSLKPNRRAVVTIPNTVPPPKPKKKVTQKTITLNAVNVTGSSGNLASALTYANTQVYHQANIKVKKGKVVTLPGFLSRFLIGKDLVLNEYPNPTSPTAEEKSLLPWNQKSGEITLFFVKKLSAGSLGEAFWPATGTGLLGVVVSNSGIDNTISHEMGHVLLNSGAHVVPDNTYLMHATAANPKKLTDAEIKTMRASPFAK